jgi:hypothetical protein
MRRWAIRLGIPLLAILIASQFVLPPYLEHRVANRLTEHGGTAHVQISAFPALGLLVGRGDKLGVDAHGLSVDVNQNQKDAFKRLDDFSQVSIDVLDSRAGPFTISRFSVRKLRSHSYLVTLSGSGTGGDVARYAGEHLGGGLGAALAGLAASAIGLLDRTIPFNARMVIDTSSGSPQASNVVGTVGGFPAGPLAQIVANSVLATI